MSDDNVAAGPAGEPVERVRRDDTPPAQAPELRPLLGELQLAALRLYGAEVEVSAGDVLFADGDQSYDLIVILEGTVEIVEHFGRPGEEVVISYGEAIHRFRWREPVRAPPPPAAERSAETPATIR
jgi:thioredoxin reductase (NADPH)